MDYLDEEYYDIDDLRYSSKEDLKLQKELDEEMEQMYYDEVIAPSLNQENKDSESVEKSKEN